jgi:hypothetical protein
MRERFEVMRGFSHAPPFDSRNKTSDTYPIQKVTCKHVCATVNAIARSRPVAQVGGAFPVPDHCRE